MINTDPHHQQKKGLVPIPTPQGEIMCVHPEFVDGQQWTTVTNKKSKGKAKVSSCNMVCASPQEAKTNVPSLTDSEKEIIVLTVELTKSFIAETHSGQSYLKKYDNMVESPPKPTAKSTKPSVKQPIGSRKSFSFLRLSQRITRKDLQHLTALTSWLNWPISQPGSPFMNS